MTTFHYTTAADATHLTEKYMPGFSAGVAGGGDYEFDDQADVRGYVTHQVNENYPEDAEYIDEISGVLWGVVSERRAV